MKTERTFYRLVPPPYYTEKDFDALEDAKKGLDDWSGKNNPNLPKESAEYWLKQGEQCKIVKITQIIEPVNI